MKKKRPANRVLALIDAHQWLVSDDWMEAIRSIAERTNDVESFMQDKELLAQMNDITALIPSHDGPVAGTKGSVRKGNVALIPIVGPIFPRANLFTMISGGTSIDMVARDTEIARAAGLEPMLVFSTPGGVVEGISDYAKTVASLNIRGFVTGTCASAGYWIGSQCSELIVSDTAIVGNIGVKAGKPGEDKALTSQNAPNKKMTASMVTEILNDLEAVFIPAVARGRGVSAEHVIEHFGKGGVFVGQKAVDAGLADGVSTLEAMLNPSANPARTNQREPSMAITKEEQEKHDKEVADAREAGATEAQASAGTAQRERIIAILALDSKKSKAAMSLAMNTDLSVDEAKATLEDMPDEAEKAPAASKPNDPLASAMDGTNPDVGNDDAGGGSGDEEPTQAQVDASWDDTIGAKA